MGTAFHGMTPSVHPSISHAIFSTSAFKGAPVPNFAGEVLGTVDEFVLDFDAGRVAYVVVSVGGFLGVGEKLYAVPWELFSIRADEHVLFVDIDKQMLLDAPGFERSRWPDMTDEQWAEEIHAHYAQKPYWNSDVTDAGDYVGNDTFDKPDRDRI